MIKIIQNGKNVYMYIITLYVIASTGSIFSLSNIIGDDCMIGNH